jgi:uncharacterized protein YhaN
MRLSELEIENFGVLANKRYQFDGGFQLIHGPNEAGKSTLLQLIREVFFGFPHISPYMFAGHEGEMAATALITLSNGRQVRYRRRKGTRNTVVGQFVDTGDTINDVALTGLLGNANADLYTKVFGFSLAELAAGEQGLSQTDLAEALYGGGLGGLANLQGLREDIRAEQDGLFSPRGGSKREINRLLAAIKEKRRTVVEATVKPREYQDANKEMSQLQEELADVRGQRERIHHRQAHLKRLAESLPSSLRLRAAEAEISELQAPAGFPANGDQRFRSARQRRDELAEELRQAREEFADLSDKLGEIKERPELVGRDADVKRLEKEVGRMRQYATHIPQRRQESETIKEAALTKVKFLNPQWGLVHLDQFQTSLVQRDAIATLEEDHQEIERERDKLESRRPDLAEEIAWKESELAKTTDVECVPGLERLVESAAEYQADRKVAEELKSAIEDARVSRESLKRQLEAPLGAAFEDAATLPLPLPETLKRYRGEFLEIDNVLRDFARRLAEAGDNVATKRRSLAEMDSEAKVPDRHRLLAQRQRRDAGWKLIRGKFVAQDPGVSDEQVAEWLGREDRPLADRYEHEVKTADQLADLRQEKAEAVARREHLAAEIVAVEERVSDLRGRQTQFEAARRELQVQWELAWKNCGITPLLPDEMIEWTRIHAEFTEETRQQAKLQAKMADLTARIAAFETKLIAAIGGEMSCEQQLVEARRHVQSARRAATLREQYKDELPKRKQQLAELDQQIECLSKRRSDFERKWRETMGQVGFPGEWPVSSATKILGGLAEARQDRDKAVALDKRVSDMETEREQYSDEVAKLCHAIAPDLALLPAEDAVERLAQRIDEARQAVKDRKTLAAQLEKAGKLVATKEQQHAKFAKEIDELLHTAGVADEAAFEKAAALARRHQVLTLEIEQLVRDVKRLASEESVEEFLAELGESKRDEVNVLRRRADEERDQIESTYQERVEKVALARDRLEKFDQASEAARRAQELENERAELAAAIDRWVPLVFAQTLLSEAIERFQREHQPEMLREIGRLFSQMTRGRYTGVRRKLDEQGTLLLDLTDGSHKEPSELSTGTREQLYLALRLAYVRHYCREAESLPLVMDDVLVNFDDERAQGTLDVLLDVAKEMQIIFMTCHQNIADRIMVAAPDMKPIGLLPG